MGRGHNDGLDVEPGWPLGLVEACSQYLERLPVARRRARWNVHAQEKCHGALTGDAHIAQGKARTPRVVRVLQANDHAPIEGRRVLHVQAEADAAARSDVAHAGFERDADAR